MRSFIIFSCHFVLVVAGMVAIAPLLLFIINTPNEVYNLHKIRYIVISIPLWLVIPITIFTINIVSDALKKYLLTSSHGPNDPN